MSSDGYPLRCKVAEWSASLDHIVYKRVVDVETGNTAEAEAAFEIEACTEPLY